MAITNKDLSEALEAQSKLFHDLLPETFQGLQAVAIAGTAGLIAMSHPMQNAETPAEIDRMLASINGATASLLRSLAAGELKMRDGTPPPPVLLAWYAQQTRLNVVNMVKTPGHA